MLLMGLLIGGAAAGYLIIAAQRPAEGPGATDGIGADASPSPGDSFTFPNPDEADLLLQLPMELRDACRRTEEPSERIGTVASVRCELELAEEADTVWYDRFASLQELSNVLLARVQAESLPRGDCGPEVPRAQGNWQVGSTHSGRLLCYQVEGSTWIVWSYDAERIVVRAVRRGNAPEDWLGLYDWWTQVRLFLR
jgi:hypothetical protein